MAISPPSHPPPPFSRLLPCFKSAPCAPLCPHQAVRRAHRGERPASPRAHTDAETRPRRGQPPQPRQSRTRPPRWPARAEAGGAEAGGAAAPEAASPHQRRSHPPSLTAPWRVPAATTGPRAGLLPRRGRRRRVPRRRSRAAPRRRRRPSRRLRVRQRRRAAGAAPLESEGATRQSSTCWRVATPPQGRPCATRRSLPHRRRAGRRAHNPLSLSSRGVYFFTLAGAPPAAASARGATPRASVA